MVSVQALPGACLERGFSATIQRLLLSTCLRSRHLHVKPVIPMAIVRRMRGYIVYYANKMKDEIMRPQSLAADS
jgi:hypothetical protein